MVNLRYQYEVGEADDKQVVEQRLEAFSFLIQKDGSFLALARNGERTLIGSAGNEYLVIDGVLTKEAYFEAAFARDYQLELLLGGRKHTDSQGFRLDAFMRPSGFGIHNLGTRKPLLHTYGKLWQDADWQKKNRRGGEDVLIRAPYYLNLVALKHVAQPRARLSALAV
jgi:hypothetical protein